MLKGYNNGEDIVETSRHLKGVNFWSGREHSTCPDFIKIFRSFVLPSLYKKHFMYYKGLRRVRRT
jgi:hypothetical protein